MSTVRGKTPLQLRHVASVDADSHGLKIIVTIRGSDGRNFFDAVGKLDVWCATKLIKDLRRALRKVRDDASERLNQAVADAEGSL